MSDSIGARLRQARELRRLTVEQVSETTKLRTHYLQALENDDYSAIPSAAQARGFLRLYASFLELDVAALLPTLEPAAPETVEAAPAPEEPAPAPAAHPSLWASLRGRFPRRSTEQGPASSKTVSTPTEPVAEAPLPASEPLPAASEAATTQRTKTAGVKKNAIK
jgi:cytoskeletal protein RodZ